MGVLCWACAYVSYLSALGTPRAKGIHVGGWEMRVSASNHVGRTERSLTVLLRILEAADVNRKSDNAISAVSMNAPLPTGSLAGGGSTALTMVGAKDAPSIFARNLDVSEVRCLGLLRRFDGGH